MKITCHIIPEKICKYNFYTVTKYLEQCRLRNDQYIKSENLDPQHSKGPAFLLSGYPLHFKCFTFEKFT